MEHHNEDSIKSKKSMKSVISEEQPLGDLKSYKSENDSISGIKGMSERDQFSPNNGSIEGTIKAGSIKSVKSMKSEAISQPGSGHSNPSHKSANSLTQESYYLLEDVTKEGLQKYLKDSMLVFDERYSIDKKEIENDVSFTLPFTW